MVQGLGRAAVDDERPSDVRSVGIRRIGVIGLGAMGTPLATLDAKAGYDVRGFDIAGQPGLAVRSRRSRAFV